MRSQFLGQFLVAQLAERSLPLPEWPGFESSHRQLLSSIYLKLTVEKEAVNGSIKNTVI